MFVTSKAVVAHGTACLQILDMGGSEMTVTDTNLLRCKLNYGSKIFLVQAPGACTINFLRP